MTFILHNIGIYEQLIMHVISGYLSSQGEDGVFLSAARLNAGIISKNNSETNYMIFYRLSDPDSTKNIQSFIRRNHLQAKIIALCCNDAEGITALGSGSDYALLLPPDPVRLLHCCKKFCKPQ